MAVLIGSIEARSTLTSSGSVDLEGARDVNAVTVGNNTFVYVTGLRGDTVSAYQLGANGSLTSLFNLADDPTLEIAGAASFASTTLGGSTYLYVNGFDDDGVSAFRVEANGSLTFVQSVIDTTGSTGLQLNGSRGQMSIATVGDAQFLVATGYDDDGLSVFRIGAGGTLTNTANVDDGSNAAYELNNARDTATAVVDGRTFIFVTGYNDNGLSSFELAADGSIAFRDSVDDAENGALNLLSAYGVATATVAGSTYVVASGEADDGLSVFRVDGSGQMTNVFNLEDNATLGLDSPRGLTTFTLQGETFVAVSAATDKALSVLHLGAGGQLTNVTEVFDTDSTALGGARYNFFTTVQGVPLLLGTGQSDNGVSTFELGGAADRIRGTVAADLILGLAGNDTLSGLGGRDTILAGGGNDKLLGGAARDILEGGAGKDSFVFTKVTDSGFGAAKRDIIRDFTRQDTINLRKIDADTTEKGNQNFTLDTGGGFDAGELAIQKSKAGLLLLVNTDNDVKAEMAILLEDYKGKIGGNDFDL